MSVAFSWIRALYIILKTLQVTFNDPNPEAVSSLILSLHMNLTQLCDMQSLASVRIGPD